MIHVVQSDGYGATGLASASLRLYKILMGLQPPVTPAGGEARPATSSPMPPHMKRLPFLCGAPLRSSGMAKTPHCAPSPTIPVCARA